MSATDDSNTTDTDDSAPGLDATAVDREELETDADGTPDDDAADDGDRSGGVGQAVGGAVGGSLSAIRRGIRGAWDGVVYGFYSSLGTDRVYQKRFKKLVKRMYKVGDADAVGFVAMKKGEIVPTPVKYRPPDADVDLDDEDENSHGYWEAAHVDQTFSAATSELSTEHIHNVPVVWLHTDDWAEMSFSGALLAEAVDMGQKDVLYKDPVFNVVELLYKPDPTAGAGGSGDDSVDVAVGDGGALEARTRLENVSAGSLDDSVIDVASPGDLDGIRVQWEKFKDLRLEQTTVEEMNQVEQRGWLAGKLEGEDDGHDKNLKWWILGLVGGMIGAFMMGTRAAGGGGGGGGGGIMPLVMSVGMLMRTAPVEVGWR